MTTSDPQAFDSLEALRLFCAENLSGEAWLKSEPLFDALSAAKEAQGEDKLRETVATVLEGWKLPDGVRKMLETAYWSYPQGSEPQTQYVWAAISKTQIYLFEREEDARKLQPTATSLFDIQRMRVFGNQPAQAVTLPTIVTDPMVDAYLTEQRRVVEEADQFGRPNVGGLHTNTVREACRSGIQAAFLASSKSLEQTPAVRELPPTMEFAGDEYVLLEHCIEYASAKAMQTQSTGDAVAWACWLDSQDPTTDKPTLTVYEPLAYRLRRPLTYANVCEQQEETDAIDVQEDLYWRLHSLSKSLESCDRIDGMENKDAYPTILDAMNLCQKFMDPKRRDEFFCPLCFDKPENIVQPSELLKTNVNTTIPWKAALAIMNQLAAVMPPKESLRAYYSMDEELRSSIHAFLKEVEELGALSTDEVVCKGAWGLGTACGKCSRCIATKPQATSDGTQSKPRLIHDFGMRPKSDAVVPVTQTIFNSILTRGNCMQAAVASLLHLPLDEVPHFAESGDAETCWTLFEDWLSSRGFEVWLMPGKALPACPFLASGKTSRGTSHMVVMQGSTLLHDPHPTRAGLAEVDHAYVLLPKSYAPQPRPEVLEAIHQWSVIDFFNPQTPQAWYDGPPLRSGRYSIRTLYRKLEELT